MNPHNNYCCELKKKNDLVENNYSNIIRKRTCVEYNFEISGDE